MVEDSLFQEEVTIGAHLGLANAQRTKSEKTPKSHSRRVTDTQHLKVGQRRWERDISQSSPRTWLACGKPLSQKDGRSCFTVHGAVGGAGVLPHQIKYGKTPSSQDPRNY